MSQARPGEKIRPRMPVQNRILLAADELFRRSASVRNTGLRTIAEWAGTNVQTLRQHFPSKDALLAQYITKRGAEVHLPWPEVPDDCSELSPRDWLKAWLSMTADAARRRGETRCELARIAADLTDEEPLSRRAIRKYKKVDKERLAKVCADAGLRDPDGLAKALWMLAEGMLVTLQTTGEKEVTKDFEAAGLLLIDAHSPSPI